MNTADFSNPLIMIDGKEVGVLQRRPTLTHPAPTQRQWKETNTGNFSFSFKAEMTPEQEKWIRWEAERPDRIKRYVSQLCKAAKNL